MPNNIETFIFCHYAHDASDTANGPRHRCDGQNMFPSIGSFCFIYLSHTFIIVNLLWKNRYLTEQKLYYLISIKKVYLPQHQCFYTYGLLWVSSLHLLKNSASADVLEIIIIIIKYNCIILVLQIKKKKKKKKICRIFHNKRFVT